MSTRLAVAIGAVLLVALGLLAPAALSAVNPDAVTGSVLRGAADDTTTAFNLVDVRALATHRFDGGGLRRGAVLHQTLGWKERAITYRSEGLRITGTLEQQTDDRLHPVVVALHGYVPPGRYAQGAGLEREERRLADAGFVVLHPDYRNFAGSSRESGRPVATPLGYPADAINAILALRRARLPGVDTSRIGLLGRSMGGGVALQVAVARPDLVDALLLYSPVSSSAAAMYDRWVRPDPALRRRVEAGYGTPASAPAFWRRASSAAYLSRVRVPVEIHHGLADPVCPEAWSVATTAGLRRAGKHVRLYTYAGEPHRFDSRAWPLFMHRTLAYFRHQLG